MTEHSHNTETKNDLIKALKALPDAKKQELPKDLTTRSYPELFLIFIQHLNQQERTIIETALETKLPFLKIKREHFHELSLLKHTAYLIPIGKNRYYLTPAFLNDYNQIVLDYQFKPIPELNSDCYKSIGHCALAESHRRKYETMTLIQCLESHYNTSELALICTLLQIKDFEHLSFKEQCLHIADKVLNDYYMLKKLFELVPSLKVLFSLMVLEDRNSYLGASEEKQSLATFMLFKNEDYAIMYLPSDVFDHLKNFFHMHHINPAKVLENTLADFSAEWMSETDEITYLKALTENQLSSEDAKKLIEALSNDHLYSDLFTPPVDNTEQKFHFYDALLQLYGFVPLKIVKYLHDQFFDNPLSINGIKKEISRFFEDVDETLTEGYFVKPILKDAYSMLCQIYHDIPYYLPASLEELIQYHSKSSYINQYEIQDSLNFFKRHIHIPQAFENNPKTLIKLLVIEELIIPSIKTLPFESDLKDTVEDWKLQGLFKKSSTENLYKHALNLYRHLRLWTLRGHTLDEYESLRNNNKHQLTAQIIDLNRLK